MPNKLNVKIFCDKNKQLLKDFKDFSERELIHELIDDNGSINLGDLNPEEQK